MRDATKECLRTWLALNDWDQIACQVIPEAANRQTNFLATDNPAEGYYKKGDCYTVTP